MPASRPNILFIVVDDCGYADPCCTGQTSYQTPALDRLTGEGIRVTQAYADSALCTNTRVALITGRYQYRLPIGLVEPLRWSDRDTPAPVRACHCEERSDEAISPGRSAGGARLLRFAGNDKGASQ
jgi:arylsulfatase A-like enzyme